MVKIIIQGGGAFLQLNEFETVPFFLGHGSLLIYVFSTNCVCFLVIEEIPITVSRRAPDKEAWPRPYHYCS